MEIYISEYWKKILNEEFKKQYFNELLSFIESEYQQHAVYPPFNEVFNAFNLCSFQDLKVVIIGQDPYHGAQQAHGLCFSVREGMRLPPSLVNIYKEIKDDLNKAVPASGSLERWAKQGVFLINATLTVRAHNAASHQKKGWEEFTDAVIRLISDHKTGVVFLLWGSYAQKKKDLIDSNKHLVLQSAHPSPFSAHKGFLGNRHFSKTNAYLKSIGKDEIDW